MAAGKKGDPNKDLKLRRLTKVITNTCTPNMIMNGDMKTLKDLIFALDIAKAHAEKHFRNRPTQSNGGIKSGIRNTKTKEHQQEMGI